MIVELLNVATVAVWAVVLIVLAYRLAARRKKEQWAAFYSMEEFKKRVKETGRNTGRPFSNGNGKGEIITVMVILPRKEAEKEWQRGARKCPPLAILSRPELLPFDPYELPRIKWRNSS